MNMNHACDYVTLFLPLGTSTVLIDLPSEFVVLKRPSCLLHALLLIADK
jgi:hypothetical protein